MLARGGLWCGLLAGGGSGPGVLIWGRRRLWLALLLFDCWICLGLTVVWRVDLEEVM